ncbi:hypothetical protein HYPSUDRAFT_32993 [Hypholoma sublateritium FD-334 SS-4]|uniref:Uncharacterized protein n=1 Tax=Hypholoma sublateritium (strain FD-334 SS-4) TaxID=945553 RepID=A0A0D2QD02_HYPSF|nr:hypothetical protein HYPSUDRAFT_32993 [Hypholoma sublateritium FD-334 SS-4]
MGDPTEAFHMWMFNRNAVEAAATTNLALNYGTILIIATSASFPATTTRSWMYLADCLAIAEDIHRVAKPVFTTPPRCCRSSTTLPSAG